MILLAKFPSQRFYSPPRLPPNKSVTQANPVTDFIKPSVGDEGESATNFLTATASDDRPAKDDVTVLGLSLQSSPGS